MKGIMTIAAVAAVLGLATAASAAWVATESFDTGYTAGAQLKTHPDWYFAGNGPITNPNIGVAGTWGITKGDKIFTWKIHPFSWATDLAVGDKVISRMDFKTDASRHFDDDRLGWMTTITTDDSSNYFGVQMDPGGTGYNIEAYWENATGDTRTSIVSLPTLGISTWYRFELEVTKLTNTSARLDVELFALNPDGSLGSSVASGSIADTAAMGNEAPKSAYFTTALLYPAYKNYTSAGSDADNAYFEIVPEPASMGLLALGGLALLRRRRKA